MRRSLCVIAAKVLIASTDAALRPIAARTEPIASRAQLGALPARQGRRRVLMIIVAAVTAVWLAAGHTVRADPIVQFDILEGGCCALVATGGWTVDEGTDQLLAWDITISCSGCGAPPVELSKGVDGGGGQVIGPPLCVVSNYPDGPLCPDDIYHFTDASGDYLVEDIGGPDITGTYRTEPETSFFSCTSPGGGPPPAGSLCADTTGSTADEFDLGLVAVYVPEPPTLLIYCGALGLFLLTRWAVGRRM